MTRFIGLRLMACCGLASAQIDEQAQADMLKDNKLSAEIAAISKEQILQRTANTKADTKIEVAGVEAIEGQLQGQLSFLKGTGISRVEALSKVAEAHQADLEAIAAELEKEKPSLIEEAKKGGKRAVLDKFRELNEATQAWAHNRFGSAGNAATNQATMNEHKSQVNAIFATASGLAGKAVAEAQEADALTAAGEGLMADGETKLDAGDALGGQLAMGNAQQLLLAAQRKRAHSGQLTVEAQKYEDQWKAMQEGVAGRLLIDQTPPVMATSHPADFLG